MITLKLFSTKLLSQVYTHLLPRQKQVLFYTSSILLKRTMASNSVLELTQKAQNMVSLDSCTI